MKCQICHEREANIVFTQIVNNEKIVLQICSECAREKGITVQIHKPTHPKMQVKVHTDNEQEAAEPQLPDIVCPSCGLHFPEFTSKGLFGCEHCIEAFREHIGPLLKQMHGTAVYGGANPQELSEEGKRIKELKLLRHELQRSIEREEYEHAAELRDRIASLEQGMMAP